MTLDPSKLLEIEVRWSRASSGPWTVLDGTGLGCDAPRLTFKAAVATGMATSAEDGIRFLESNDDGKLTYDQVADACRLIVPTTEAHVAIEIREQDRFLDGEEPLKDFTPPIFAVLGTDQEGSCRDEDLQFVLNASVDVGLLLQHAREQQQIIEALRAELARLRP